MRVLLVEDDITAARGVALLLKSGGAVVDEADTGQEALELVRHYDYDILVLDLMLPDMEGYEVVRRMRASRIDTPVLILSGLSRHYPSPLSHTPFLAFSPSHSLSLPPLLTHSFRVTLAHTHTLFHSLRTVQFVSVST